MKFSSQQSEDTFQKKNSLQIPLPRKNKQNPMSGINFHPSQDIIIEEQQESMENSSLNGSLVHKINKQSFIQTNESQREKQEAFYNQQRLSLIKLGNDQYQKEELKLVREEQDEFGALGKTPKLQDQSKVLKLQSPNFQRTPKSGNSNKDPQSYQLMRQNIDIPEEDLAGMTKEKRIFYRYLMKEQSKYAQQKKTEEMEQKLKQQEDQLFTERLRKRSCDFSTQSQSKIALFSKRSSKYSNLNLQDFEGDQRALKYAEQYKKQLTGHELKRMKSMESREKIKYILYLILTVTLNLINLFACATFVIEDYISYDKCKDWDKECANVGLEVIEKLEVTFSLIFLLELCYNIYQQSKPKYQFFLKKDAIVDILTIFPPLLNLILENKIKIGFLRMLRMLKVMRIIRIFKMLKKADNKSSQGSTDQSNDSKPTLTLSPIQNQIIILNLNIFTTVFIAAGVIMFVDNMIPFSFSYEMKFVDAIYYMIITSGTIGYGDYFPTNYVSRLTLIILIVTIISVFGNQISSLAAIIKEADFYDTQYQLKGHIIVLGTLKIKVLTRFLLHFYKNQAQNQHQPKCIIIGEQRISQRMKILLNYSLFEDNVFYLSVQGIDQDCIKKACFKDAAAIFYISEQFHCNPDSSDKKALFINHFLQNNGVTCNMYMQLCVTDQVSFMRLKTLENIGIGSSQNRINQLSMKNQVQNILYINMVKTKFQILAYSIFNEGTLQLFSNWFLNDHDLIEESYFSKKKNQKQIQPLIDLASLYQQQLDYKCYLIDFPICFIGKTFRQAVKIINNINHGYQGKLVINCILFGIKRSARGNYNSQEKVSPIQSPSQAYNKLGSQSIYQSGWHLNQDTAQFNCGSDSYIINSPQTMIQYADKALILASCDDIIRFFHDKNSDEILRYEYYNSNSHISSHIFPHQQSTSQLALQNIQNKQEYLATRSRNNQVQPKSTFWNKNKQDSKPNQIDPQDNQQYYSTSNRLIQETADGFSQRQLLNDGLSSMKQQATDQFQISLKLTGQPQITNNLINQNNQYDNDLEMEALSVPLPVLREQASSFVESQCFSSSSEGYGESPQIGTLSDNNQIEQFIESDTDRSPTPISRNKKTSPLRTIDPSYKAKKDIIYSKILGDLDTKLDTFIHEGLSYQLSKLYDFKCLLSSTHELTIDLSIQDVKGKIGNHIIICGGQNQGIQFFIEEVRKITDVPICLMSHLNDMEAHFNKISCKFEHIFFFKGNCLNIRHLKNANLKQAQSVVVLSQEEENQPFDDSQSIMITQLIKNLYPLKKVFTELYEISHLSMLEETIEEVSNLKGKHASYFLSKELMAGRILFSQQMEILASSQSIEPHLLMTFLKIINQKFSITTQIDSIQSSDQQADERKRLEIIGQSRMQDVNENSQLISLRIPSFMEGQDYWQLQQEIYEQRDFLFIGMYKSNFLNDSQIHDEIIKELQDRYDDSAHDEFNSPRSKCQRKSSNFNNFSCFQTPDHKVNQSHSGLFDDLNFMDFDTSVLRNVKPLMILNPPLGTKLKAGDYIITLGQLQKSKLTKYLEKRAYKISKKQKDKRKLTLMLKRQKTLHEKNMLNDLAKELQSRCQKQTFNVNLLKEQNKEMSQFLQNTLSQSSNNINFIT